MSELSSYGKVYGVGHKDLADLLNGEIVVEEKIDGSQFSFSFNESGELKCRSNGQQLPLIVEYEDVPEGRIELTTTTEKMFRKAVAAAAKRFELAQPGWVYRCEYLQSPKHNTLAYERTPKDNLIIFDVMTGPETFLSPEDKANEAARLGLECVPCYYVGKWESDLTYFGEWLKRRSILGGPVEGIVIKNYNRFTSDGKLAKGKIVTEAFKEAHRDQWKVSNPCAKDFVQMLAQSMRTEARWRKAVQHLREAGKCEGTPRDIGALMKNVHIDIDTEDSDQIAQALLKHFLPQIKRAVCAGLPDWYKNELGIVTETTLPQSSQEPTNETKCCCPSVACPSHGLPPGQASGGW
jgi:RNA ligase-like protein